MKTPSKHALLTASLVLVGASAVGCGGGGGVGGGVGGPPTDASEKEFCTSLTSLFADLGSMTDASDADTIKAIKTWGKGLEEVGTPENISDEGRKGFELITEQVAELDEGDTTEDFAQMDAELSESENKAVDAFDTYTTDTCASMSPEAPELPELPEPS